MEVERLEPRHRCAGPVIFRGDYEIRLVDPVSTDKGHKKNHEPTKLLAHGTVHKCSICQWHFAYPEEGIYVEDTDVSV